MSKSPAHRPALYILRPPSPPALRLDPAAHTPSSFLGRKGRSGSPQVMPDALFSLSPRRAKRKACFSDQLHAGRGPGRPQTPEMRSMATLAAVCLCSGSKRGGPPGEAIQ